MKKFNQKDVRWLAYFSENEKMAKVVPYLVKDETMIVDLLSNKLHSKNVLKNSALLKEYVKTNERMNVKDWNTEDMVRTYYCILKKTSESHATKFLARNETLDEMQIQSWTMKLEKELQKLSKEASKEHKKENKNKKSHDSERDF